MREQLSHQFAGELRAFFVVSLLNVVFSALVMAFGIQFIVSSVVALAEGEISLVFPAIRILLGGAGAMVGLRWLLASVHIFSGIKQLRDEYSSLEDPASDETLTGLIIRMISYYRENRETIQTMIIAGIFCGFCVLILGIISSLEFFSSSFSSGTFTIDIHRVLPSAIPAYFIAVVSLFSAAFFQKFSKVWDLRQQEIEQAEENLQHVLEQG
jgi:hypothetical protein